MAMKLVQTTLHK